MRLPIYTLIKQCISGHKYFRFSGFRDLYKDLIRLYQKVGDSLMVSLGLILTINPWSSLLPWTKHKSFISSDIGDHSVIAEPKMRT